MRALARLDLACSGADVRRSLVDVLSPDNKGVPAGMLLSMASRGNSVRVEVASESAQRVVSTCMSIAQDVALFEQVWLLSTASDGRVRRRR